MACKGSGALKHRNDWGVLCRGWLLKQGGFHLVGWKGTWASLEILVASNGNLENVWGMLGHSSSRCQSVFVGPHSLWSKKWSCLFVCLFVCQFSWVSHISFQWHESPQSWPQSHGIVLVVTTCWLWFVMVERSSWCMSGNAFCKVIISTSVFVALSLWAQHNNRNDLG